MPAFHVCAAVRTAQQAALQDAVERHLSFLHPRVRSGANGDELEIRLTVIAEDGEAADDYARGRLLHLSTDELSVRVTDSDVQGYVRA